jgi:hypothetical protein
MHFLDAEDNGRSLMKPECGNRYVGDLLSILPHGPTALRDFFGHLNIRHPKFFMELESDSELPCIDVLVNRRPDNALGYAVYRKPTHSDRYVLAASQDLRGAS